MSAVLSDLPASVAFRLITQPCDTCGAMGYHDNGESCNDCEGSGRRTLRLVGCPVHRMAVAIGADGRLLGQCDGCAAEAARALAAIGRGGWN